MVAHYQIFTEVPVKKYEKKLKTITMRSFYFIYVFVVALVFMGTSQDVTAQRRYVDHTTKDGVTFQYRWVNSKWLDKNSPLELRLKIKNDNDYPVSVSYGVEFYMGPVMEESSEITELCINRKLAKTGRLNGMYYQSAKLNNEQLQSKDFYWEISDLEIEKVESCR